MKQILIIFVFLCVFTFCKAQHENEYKIRLSIIEKFEIDSMSLYNFPMHFKRLEAKAFGSEQVSTPERAVQAFISFNTKEWGKSLASVDYPNIFPGEETLKNRNTDAYVKNVFAKVFFTFYFKYKDKSYAGCYVESYATVEYPVYYTMFIFESVEGKWLLADDWFLSRINDLSELKPTYAISLFQGKRLEKYAKYNELFKSIYQNNTIDIGVFNTLIKEKRNYFSELLNN